MHNKRQIRTAQSNRTYSFLHAVDLICSTLLWYIETPSINCTARISVSDYVCSMCRPCSPVCRGRRESQIRIWYSRTRICSMVDHTVYQKSLSILARELLLGWSPSSSSSLFYCPSEASSSLINVVHAPLSPSVCLSVCLSVCQFGLQGLLYQAE